MDRSTLLSAPKRSSTTSPFASRASAFASVLAPARLPQAASAPCDEVAFRAKVLASPFGEGDLFQHQHGGPSGAVWNPQAPLYLFVKGEGVVQLGTRTLNGGTLEGGWRWFRCSFWS